MFKMNLAKTRTKMAIVMMGLVLAATVFLALPKTTHATALGYEYWGAISVNISGQSVGIPSGQLTHLITGSGYHIDTDGANYAAAATLCDASIRFTYGNGAYVLNSDVNWGCSRGGQWKYKLNWTSPRGDACAELWIKNWKYKVATQCHYIEG